MVLQVALTACGMFIHPYDEIDIPFCFIEFPKWTNNFITCKRRKNKYFANISKMKNKKMAITINNSFNSIDFVRMIV